MSARDWLVAVGVAAVVATGCTHKATPEVCQKACDRVAGLEVAPKKKLGMTRLHELDEGVERTEDQSKETIARLEKELAAGDDPQWDDKLLLKRKLSKEALRTLRERNQRERDLLKRQREAALQSAKESVGEARKKYEAAKGLSDGEIAKALADATAACAAKCQQRTLAEAQCLLRVQAIEDVAICEQQR
jgi:hypothetical protein